MFRKLTGAAVVAVAVVAMALPAGAATKTLNGKFNKPKGDAQLVVKGKAYTSAINVRGLKAGTYSFDIDLAIDTNHDGIGEASSTVHMCNITVPKQHKSNAVFSCPGGKVSGKNLYASWGVRQQPNLYTATLTKLTSTGGTLVGQAPLR